MRSSAELNSRRARSRSWEIKNADIRWNADVSHVCITRWNACEIGIVAISTDVFEYWAEFVCVFFNTKFLIIRVGPVFQAWAGTITNFIFVCGLRVLARNWAINNHRVLFLNYYTASEFNFGNNNDVFIPNIITAPSSITYIKFLAHLLAYTPVCLPTDPNLLGSIYMHASRSPFLTSFASLWAPPQYHPSFIQCTYVML